MTARLQCRRAQMAGAAASAEQQFGAPCLLIAGTGTVRSGPNRDQRGVVRTAFDHGTPHAVPVANRCGN
jgi:hypothetical protein